MEGQQLRDEIARVSQQGGMAGGMAGLMTAADRPPAPEEPSDREIPERTGVQAPDRILEIADEIGRARRRLLSTIDRVGV